jgi:hypothetical protein
MNYRNENVLDFYLLMLIMSTILLRVIWYNFISISNTKKFVHCYMQIWTCLPSLWSKTYSKNVQVHEQQCFQLQLWLIIISKWPKYHAYFKMVLQIPCPSKEYRFYELILYIYGIFILTTVHLHRFSFILVQQ